MRRSINTLSSAIRPLVNPSSSASRWITYPTIPPRAGEPSTRRLHASSRAGSSSNGNSRQPDGNWSRDIHSTARSNAQPNVKPEIGYEYVYEEKDNYGVSNTDWDDVPFDLDISRHVTLEGEEYDFSTPQFEVDELPYTPFEYTNLPQPPTFDDLFDPTAAKKKKRRKRRIQIDQPALPEGQLPADGLSRFDWRDTSLSSGLGMGNRGEGDLCFPHLARVKRVEGEKKKLEVGETFHDEVNRYEKHFAPLLQAEYDEEERILLQRLKEWGSDRLEREGYMLDKLGASLVTKQPKNIDGKVWTFSRVAKDDNTSLPFNKIDIGSYVFLSRTNPCFDPVLEDGTVKQYNEDEVVDDKEKEKSDINPAEWLRVKVYSKGRKFIRLVIPSPIDGLDRGHWRLDLGMSDWALQMQLQAIKSLHNDPVLQDMQDIQLQPNRSTPSHPYHPDSEDATIEAILAENDRARDKQIQTILNGTATRDLILRAFQTDYQPLESSADLASTPFTESATMKPTDVDATPLPTPPAALASPRGILARDQLIQSWAARYRRPRALQIEGDPTISLNPSQLRAMAMILSERISLVQGPPGTGKTRVIVEVIKLLKQHFKIPFPILVCAHTNVAVDNILAPLRKEGIKALRSGSSDRVRDDLKEYTMEQVEMEHPLFDKVDGLRRDMKRIEEEMVAGDKGTNFPKLFEDKKTLSKRIYGLQRMIDREVLLSGDICTTLLSAATRKLHQIDFPMVFIDEASMATEPLTIVPLMKGSSHVAIIGDHKQLPPVIISPEAHAGGLTTSLFERLIHEKHIPSIMLDTQYRMHPAISSFPNRAFYGNALKDGPPLNGTNSDPPITSFLVENSNITFLDHDHPESPQSSSLANYGDAAIVCNLVADLLYHNPTLKGSEIGIIAPYTAQVRLILSYMLDDQDRQEAFAEVLGPERVKELLDIEIKTVDGFQGREKETMIVSMVRSNPGGWVGFLGDWRRLNVALTRARRGLFIIGSARTLAKAQYGRAASEQLPQGGAQVLRGHIQHLRKEGLIMRAE